jgi:hypothetical protein
MTCDVTFSFAGDDDPADNILVRNCPPDLLAELQAAEAGKEPDAMFTIECSANGGPELLYVFRAGRIRDVQAGGLT